MRTAEEVAAEIVGPNIDGNKYHKAKIRLVSQALTAYSEERVGEAYTKGALEQLHVNQQYLEQLRKAGGYNAHHINQAFVRGRDQALEEAAKTMWDSYNSGMNPSETADAIRALKAKPTEHGGCEGDIHKAGKP